MGIGVGDGGRQSRDGSATFGAGTAAPRSELGSFSTFGAGTALTLSESETTLALSEPRRLCHVDLEEVAVAAGFEGSAIEVGEVSYGKRTRVKIGSPLARGFFGHGLNGGFLNAAIGKGTGNFGEVQKCFETANERFNGVFLTFTDAGELRGGGEFSIGAAGFGNFGIKANDVREHDADGLAVDDAEVCGEWIGAGMSRAEHAVFNGDSGKGGGEEHSTAAFEVAGIFTDLGKTGDTELECFVRVNERECVALAGDGGFDSVGDGINAGTGGDAWRLGKGEQGIENGDFGGGFGIATGHFRMRFFIGNQGVGLAFAAGAGGGGNGDEREHRFGGFAGARIVVNASAIGQDEIAAFGRIHGAAAAEADDKIDVGIASKRNAALDGGGGGVFIRMIEESDEKAGGFKILLDLAGMAGRDNSGIGDEEDAFGSIFAGQLPCSFGATGSKNEADPGLIIEGLQGAQWHHRRYGLVLAHDQ